MSAGLKYADLEQMDVEELTGKLGESRRELYELRFKHAVGQLDDHRQISTVRKDIARILTSLRQRQLGTPASVEAVAPAAGDAAQEETE